jgi:malate dehydrogenase
MAEPLKVLVTGAAGQIAYSLLYTVAKGDVFGHHQPIILHLLDIEAMMGVLEGVVMEMQDCALPLLKEVIATADINKAFQDIDVACLVGAMPRREGMERKDLLKANVKIFKQQGEALDKLAKKTVKVVVVGNPANTNCCICMKYAPSIPRQNFSCLTRLDQNRAVAQIANRLGVSTSAVKNPIIWGNHSNTQYPDVHHATVNIQGKVVPVFDAVKDDSWLKNGFISTVQKRGAAVIAARKLSSAMSAAKATCDHMRDWWHGTKEGEWLSMGVCSDGSYGIQEGLIYSFPLRIKPDKSWEIVQGLSINDFSRAKMDATMKELSEEKAAAEEICLSEG